MAETGRPTGVASDERPADTTPAILTITLNPALDVTTTIDQLLPHRKLRCGAPRYDPGGGGVNVSRAIRELGGDSRAFVAIGGGTGAHYRALIEAAGLDCVWWKLRGETRSSLTVMETASADHFRFVLPGPEQDAAAAPAILAALRPVIAGCRYVVGSGSLLPGIPDDFYGAVADLAREEGATFIIDTHGAALRGALGHRPAIVRLNHLEAQELLGGNADGAVHRLGRDLVSRGLAEIAIVTVGEEGAILATSAGETEIRPPKVAVRSAVGAGDSFVGALTLALSRGWPIEAATRYGVAAAAAAVTTEATELCRADQVEAYFREITAGAVASRGVD